MFNHRWFPVGSIAKEVPLHQETMKNDGKCWRPPCTLLLTSWSTHVRHQVPLILDGEQWDGGVPPAGHTSCYPIFRIWSCSWKGCFRVVPVSCVLPLVCEEIETRNAVLLAIAGELQLICFSWKWCHNNACPSEASYQYDGLWPKGIIPKNTSQWWRVWSHFYFACLVQLASQH